MSDDIEVKERAKKASFNEQCVGYFEWDGLPCRVRKDDESPHVLHAEMYIPGRGYVPANSVEVFFKGHTLSKDHYQELLLSLTFKKRSSH